MSVVEYSNPRLRVAGVMINRWRNTATAAELADEIVVGVERYFLGTEVWLDRRVPLWQGMLPSSIAAAPERGPAPARTCEEDDLRAEQARARTEARDAAYGWGSARRKLDKKTRAWIAALERARELGALPGVLGDYVREGAERAGIEPAEVPAEVWRAAGLDHP